MLFIDFLKPQRLFNFEKVAQSQKARLLNAVKDFWLKVRTDFAPAK